MRRARVCLAVVVPLMTVAFGVWFSLRPMSPSGSLDHCGNAWHAASMDTSGDNSVVPTVGQLCQPLGAHRLGWLAVVVLVGLVIGYLLLRSAFRPPRATTRESLAT